MMEASDVDSSSWEREVSNSTILTVVYFWHERCPWCFRFSPTLEQVAEEYRGKIKFARLNVFANSTNQEIADNYGIMSTPTLLFLCGGRPVGQAVGLMSKEDLEKGLNDMLARYKTCLSQSTELRPSYIV
jgi:thioredoxin 1